MYMAGQKLQNVCAEKRVQGGEGREGKDIVVLNFPKTENETIIVK